MVELCCKINVLAFQVRQILSFCPNITHLDLTQTDVTDFAFDRLVLKMNTEMLTVYDKADVHKTQKTYIKSILSFLAGHLSELVTLWSTWICRGVRKSLITP